jgi:hypothetical protein
MPLNTHPTVVVYDTQDTSEKRGFLYRIYGTNCWDFHRVLFLASEEQYESITKTRKDVKLGNTLIYNGRRQPVLVEINNSIIADRDHHGEVVDTIIVDRESLKDRKIAMLVICHCLLNPKMNLVEYK